ncbi:hypothetical protein [Gemmatimonas phototrophica]|uniref:Ig-like domain-containing protein n=1 Tax=Gemmatimonas phototrophica TaxID=1379270 RepID=A0A143BGK1_9BACT|nr:hypothetical protein [Gemmatimonas phototrophica]AMW04178.1 hypothetical protein GEMMAAP_03675 [Gemmatimonas phototrophica]
MRRSTTLACLLALLAPLGACTTNEPVTTEVGGPAFAKATTTADPTATWYLPAANSGLTGDGAYLTSGSTESVYANGVCGVSTRIFASATGSGDATLQTDNPTSKTRTCAAFPRKVTLSYVNEAGVAIVDRRPVFMNVRSIATFGSAIAVGETRDGIFAVNLSGTGSGCNALRWNIVFDGATTGASYISVTRLDPTTYQVRSAPGAKAYCVDNGQLYDIHVNFRLVSSRAI